MEDLMEDSLLHASWTNNEHLAFLAGISGPSFAQPWHEDDSSSIKAPQLARSNPEDNPTYDEAMKGPYANEYYEACRTELKTLVDDLDCWEREGYYLKWGFLLVPSSVLLLIIYHLFFEFWLICLKVLMGGHRAAAQFLIKFRTDDGQTVVTSQPNDH